MQKGLPYSGGGKVGINFQKKCRWFGNISGYVGYNFVGIHDKNGNVMCGYFYKTTWIGVQGTFLLRTPIVGINGVLWTAFSPISLILAATWASATTTVQSVGRFTLFHQVYKVMHGRVFHSALVGCRSKQAQTVTDERLSSRRRWRQHCSLSGRESTKASMEYIRTAKYGEVRKML